MSDVGRVRVDVVGSRPTLVGTGRALQIARREEAGLVECLRAFRLLDSPRPPPAVLVPLFEDIARRATEQAKESST